VYRDEGWIWADVAMDPRDQRTWLPWLETSAARFMALLRDTLDAWLTRRIEMIDTYAGLDGWPVPDIFGRSAESIDALQDAQRVRHAR
jgi:hypothetical protein